MRVCSVLCIAWLWSSLAVHCPAAEKVELVAGGKQPVAALPATESRLDGPFGVDFTSNGHMIIVEIAGHRVLSVDEAGILTRLAGTGEKGFAGNGGPAEAAQFNGMHSVAIAPNGHIYIADTWNNCVRKIDPASGLISLVAGTGEKGFAGDGGPAAQALCGGIYSVALNKSGELLVVADLDNRRIRQINLKTGIITTIAGNGERGIPQDGSRAVAAPLVDPRAAIFDSQGRVYVLERSGHALRVVETDGTIRTVAGTGKPGFAGDGGPALQALLRGPKHLCLDAADNVLIADTDNHVIRKYLPATGTIVRVAGNGEKGTAGVGGPPQNLQMHFPHGVCFNRSGVLFIVDSHNDRVLKIVESAE